MYTSHATKIINKNIEKASFHEIIAFDYRRDVFSKLRLGGKIEDRARGVRFNIWT